MVANASSLRSPMTQSMAAAKPPRRAMPIIPAIPRKLEMKAQQDTRRTGIPKPEAEKEKQSCKGTPKHYICVTGDQNLSLANHGDATDEILEPKKDSPTFTQELAKGNLNDSSKAPGPLANSTLDRNGKPAVLIEDFGIGKHGFMLPPPFYPSHEPAGSSDTHLPLHDTDLRNEGEIAAEQAVSNLSSLPNPQSLSSTLHSHPKTPDDVTPSPTQSSYQGYGHVQYVPFYPKPTPPTDASISPTHSAYPEFGHSHSISFYPPSSSLSVDTSSPTQSSYQGYTYSDAYPGSGAFPQSYNNTQQLPSTSLPFRHEYGSGMSYYSHVPAFSSLGSHPPLTPSVTPLNSATKESPNNLLHYQNSTEYSASTASTMPQDLESPHRTTSESTFGLEDTSSFSNSSKFGSPTVVLDRDSAFELWRTAMLENLQHVPLETLSDQPSLSSYLLRRFNNDDTYADCCLQVTHESHRFQTVKFCLHSLLIAQSPTLQALVNTSAVAADGRRLLCLEVHDHYSTPAAIKFALRVCYGESPHIFTGSTAFMEPSKSAADVSISWMDEALAFAAVGQVLQLNSVITRGIQIASGILNWDNLEGAICFTLDRGLDRTSDLISHSQPSVKSSTAVPACSNQGTPSSANKDSPIEPTPFSMSPDVQANVNGQDAITDVSKALLYQCLDFIVSNCPGSWDLDASARPLADNGRLPAIAGSRSPMSKSRLSRIQFGDHPSEISAKLCNPNTILSTILLSIPFTLLKYLLDHFEESIARRNSRSIVAERERRRLRVLKNDSVSSCQKQAAVEVWAEAGWEEFVAEQENSRLLVARKWTGF